MIRRLIAAARARLREMFAPERYEECRCPVCVSKWAEGKR